MENSCEVDEDIDGTYEYSPKKTHDMEGSYAPNDTLKLKIQLWKSLQNMKAL